jgi:hypothetical protein
MLLESRDGHGIVEQDIGVQNIGFFDYRLQGGGFFYAQGGA